MFESSPLLSPRSIPEDGCEVELLWFSEVEEDDVEEFAVSDDRGVVDDVEVVFGLTLWRKT